MIEKYLKYLIDEDASDLHLKVGNYPIVRINGELEHMTNESKLNVSIMEDIMDDLLDDNKKEEFTETKDIDFSYSSYGIGRFRIHFFLQRNTLGIAIRKIEDKIKSFEELGLPKTLKDIAKEKRGMILVTGATGNGKSTTVSSLIEHININYKKNIITLEDPIEFLFIDKESIISQREIPSDILSYELALKHVLRQDPDVIYIGELRDRETIEAALKAAETGHLVISTLHTVNAVQSITRIIDFYPEEYKKHIRGELANNLRAVISQRLIISKDKNSRVVATEVLKTTSTIKELILKEENIEQIYDIMKDGKDINGMQTFDQSIAELYGKDKISYESALAYATVKKIYNY